MSDIVDLIQATVLLEQVVADDERTLGTGFVVLARGDDGSPRTILITARHVFERMPRDQVQVGFRTRQTDGTWRYAPAKVRIRDADGGPLWTQHPTQDVAVIELPSSLALTGLPASELPGERALQTLGVKPGDELMVLGFPAGFASNSAGFPILRSGRIASYPLSPADRYPTYLVDFNVFGGNSGGPVYAAVPRPGAPGAIVITGLLTQQIEISGQRLAIGNVTQADFITETLSLLPGGAPAEMAPTTGEIAKSDALPASTAPEPSNMRRLKDAWSAFVEGFEVLMRRAWIVVRDGWMQLTTPDPKTTR